MPRKQLDLFGSADLAAHRAGSKADWLAGYRAALRDAQRIADSRGMTDEVAVLLADLVADVADVARDSLAERRRKRSAA